MLLFTDDIAVVIAENEKELHDAEVYGRNAARWSKHENKYEIN